MMNNNTLSQLNLVETINNQVITTSLKVAKKFEKDHKNILRDINRLKK